MSRRIQGTNIECGSVSFIKEQSADDQGVSKENISPDDRKKASKVKEKVIGIRELKKLWRID